MRRNIFKIRRKPEFQGLSSTKSTPYFDVYVVKIRFLILQNAFRIFKIHSVFWCLCSKNTFLDFAKCVSWFCKMRSVFSKSTPYFVSWLSKPFHSVFFLYEVKYGVDFENKIRFLIIVDDTVKIKCRCKKIKYGNVSVFRLNERTLSFDRSLKN